MSAVAAASWRSATRMSGRRLSRVDGLPIPLTGFSPGNGWGSSDSAASSVGARPVSTASR